MADALIRRDRLFEFMIPRAVEGLDLRHGTALYMEDVSVSFDGFKAINALDFYLDLGELRCVIGPNGAGKSTMMDIITGKTRPDEGSCWFGQRHNLLRLDEAEIANLGIGRKFQKATVFESLTVFENLELSLAGGKSLMGLLRAKLTPHAKENIEAVLETIGLMDLQHKRAGSLSHGQKQWLEIGVLLMQNPLLLLVDEPAAGMTHQEIERTGELLRELSGEHSIVVVEHDMDFVRTLGCKVTVLHQGSVLAEGDMADIQNNPRVIEVYLGH